MRFLFSAVLLAVLLAPGAVAQSSPQKSGYEAEAEKAATAQKAYPQKLLGELVALRDAGLADDYAYRQVAHLTDNIGPRPAGSSRRSTGSPQPSIA